MMVEATYKAIKRKIESIGILPTAKLIINYLANKIYYREFMLYYVDVSTYHWDPKEISKEIVAKEIRNFMDLSEREIDTIREYIGKKYIKEIKERLANNWRLYLGYINGELAGGVWAMTNKSGLKTKAVPLLDGDVFYLNAWTFPAFRGKKIFPFLLSFMSVKFQEEKFQRAYGSVHKRNIASLRSHATFAKFGYQYFINFEAYNLLGREIVIWKPGSRENV